jgi:hypothetical protein
MILIHGTSAPLGRFSCSAIGSYLGAVVGTLLISIITIGHCGQGALVLRSRANRGDTGLGELDQVNAHVSAGSGSASSIVRLATEVEFAFALIATGTLDHLLRAGRWRGPTFVSLGGRLGIRRQ